MASSPIREARSGSSGDAWETGARGGFVVSGVLHLMLGYVIVRIAFGGGGEASQGSVLESMRGTAVGVVLLWVFAAALAALAAWQAADAVHLRDTADRAKAAGKAALYLALTGTAVTAALGTGGSSGDQQAQGLAARLMGLPAGQLLVGAIGLGILAGGGYHVVKGVTRRFEDDLERPSAGEIGAAARWLGTVGYCAKGVALGAVGVLFVYAAVTHDPDRAEGVDGAIRSLRDLPGGPAIIAVVGAGFAAYGLYSFARARYARL
ncbi:DUF1206 domain-containing protein [Demequina pelophila]|uniref:DUF1206 domain-containing protein n=1 Tax=Demequina pelophila TaxID=1638984 RepID=UPI000780E5A5|nr:DUF1206 domain-containing protein [Demequina pelophila]